MSAAKRRAEIERLCPGLLAYLGSETYNGKRNRLFRPDLDGELGELVPPRTVTRPPSQADQAAGAYFDVAQVDRFLRFARRLRHIKGRSFAGKPLELDLWQIVYFIGPIFGWHRADGFRVFREALLEVPRKNGKSTLCAAIALYLLVADREPGAEVISLAKTKKQGRAVFNVACAMAERSPTLSKLVKPLKATGVVNYPRTDSDYWVLSSDSSGDDKHGANLHGAIVDELHVIVDAELIGTVETSTGSRDQPLIVYITTAGIASKSPVWMEKRTRAIQASAGVTEEPELWGVIYGADPKVARNGRWELEEVWRAANPGFGRSLKGSYIASEARKAKRSAAALNRFLRLHLGIPQEAVSSWVELTVYDRSASIVDPDELIGAKAYGGMDLSSSIDLAALALVFPDETNTTLDVVMRFWTPEEGLAARATRDRGDYEQWVKDGFLTTTPGETIDYDLIEDEFRRLHDRYEIVKTAYDPWGAKQLRTRMEKAGADIYELRQGYASLSAPMKEAEKLIYEGRLRHGGNPVLRFCVSNVVAALDPAGNIKPDRKRSTSRIDGVAALIDALAAWLRDTGGGESAYEDGDLVVV